MNPNPSPQAAVPPPALDPHAIYLSPSGRCCRLCPSEAARPIGAWVTMVYDRADGGPGVGTIADAFFMARANWHLLRRLA